MKYESSEMKDQIDYVKDECYRIASSVNAITEEAIANITDSENWNSSSKSSFVSVSNSIKQTNLALNNVLNNIIEYMETVQNNYTNGIGGGGASFRNPSNKRGFTFDVID